MKKKIEITVAGGSNTSKVAMKYFCAIPCIGSISIFEISLLRSWPDKGWGKILVK